jgi:protein-tyrosine phosphatase
MRPEPVEGPSTSSGDIVRVVFVCWGNICRSPMAERIAERMAEQQRLSGVAFSSAATSTEELGEPIDPRAMAVLKEHGYRTDHHRARRITRAEIESADLVIAMEDIHLRKMLAIAPGATNLSLLSEYDPAAEPGSGIPDPWYGTPAGFYGTLEAVEAAMPGVLGRIRDLKR